MAITRFLRSWRKPQELELSAGEMRRHHDMLLALRHLAKHPTEYIWIPGVSSTLTGELQFLVDACGGPGNIAVTDRFESGPAEPAGRRWELKDPTKAKAYKP